VGIYSNTFTSAFVSNDQFYAVCERASEVNIERRFFVTNLVQSETMLAEIIHKSI
jgi:hypothetical protein